jgi:hypothetical protein
MFREDLYNVTVTVVGTDGRQFKARFDKMTGGGAKSKTTKYRPANGLEDEQTLGGAVELENIKVTKLSETLVNEWEHWLLQQTGRASMTVAKQPIDNNGAPFGQALVYGGLLEACTPPPTDSNSSNAAVIELEQSSVTPIS